MLGRGEGLEEEHPQMRHEVPRNAVVRVIEKNIHDDISISRTSTAGSDFRGRNIRTTA